MLRGEPKGQASPVPTGRPSSPLSSLREDQDPGRGRAARPTPGAHSPSPALRRSWTARAARACSAALRPARRAAAGGLDSGDGRSSERSAHRALGKEPQPYARTTTALAAGTSDEQHERARHDDPCSGQPRNSCQPAGGRCGSRVAAGANGAHGRLIRPAQSHARRAHGLSGRFGRRAQGPDRPQLRS